ncbi:SigE family RNA polymerase sigma factor, partial [Streptomyces sp. SB3404]|nr:SigE family RNA polymerase sigma factor [Streptomyces boncukensis]
MNTLHSTATSAVLHTRLHVPSVPAPSARSGEKSGAALSGRGCARGTGRKRPPHIAVVEGLRGEPL